MVIFATVTDCATGVGLDALLLCGYIGLPIAGAWEAARLSNEFGSDGWRSGLRKWKSRRGGTGLGRADGDIDTVVI